MGWYVQLILLVILFLLPINSWATYYVRSDGSNSTNCTGQADAAYDGSGTGEACAFSHPFYATGWCGDYPSNCHAGSMASGDDLIVVNGTYNMGYSATFADCSSFWSYGCAMQAVVDGTSGNHTTIKGCTSSGCSNDADRPGFYGMGRTLQILNLNSSDYVDIQDIDVYDTGTCGEGHSSYGCGSADSAEASARDGVLITSASNITLTDMKIHGMRRNGVLGGSVSNITFDNVDINYNSFAGYDGDSCSGAGTCGNSGNIIFQNGSEVKYNGCVETSTYGTIASEGCYSQDQSGYGDGIGMGNTGGNWTFTNVDISHNVSDGLDLLYLNRGSYSGGSVTIKKSLFEGNAGNNIKVPNNSYIEDTFNIANCGYFYGQSFTCTSGTCGASFNHCRANGNAFSIEFKSGDSSTPKIYNNTILTNSDVAIMTSGTCTTGTDVFVKNNILLGGREFNDDTSINGAGGNDSTSIYYDSDVNCDADFVEDYNICDDFKEGSPCPAAHSVQNSSPSFTGTIKQGPYTSPGYYTAADYKDQLTISISSPARGMADTGLSGTDSDDYNSVNRGAAWDAGAVEYTSGGSSLTESKWCGRMFGVIR